MPANDKGLSEEEAKKLLSQFGPNTLPEKPPPSRLSIFLEQLKSPLVYVLLAAGAITIVLRDFSDSVIIFLAVFVNTILGYIQEERANKSLSELKKFVHPEASVIREGKTIKINATDIVPGDMIVLSQGDKIPADGILTEVNRFYVSEAILTGESVVIAKKAGDKVFMGTIVTAGKAIFRIEKTGEETEMGKIAMTLQEPSEDTPLREQIKSFSKQLSILVLVLTVLVFIVGVVTGKEIGEVFTTSVALAVSSIPEGLLVGLTVVLAVGMQRILARKGLTRKLVSAETLGGVTTICVDKTGTLTRGQMQVSEVLGDEDVLCEQMIIANDLDDPLVLAGWEWAKGRTSRPDTLRKKATRLDSIPFTSENRFFASLNRHNGKNTLFVNGAPDYVLSWTNLDNKEKTKINKEIKRLTREGKRLIGLAQKDVPSSKKEIGEKDITGELTWVGILAFSDPVRDGVAEALIKTQKAGINILVITGDYQDTAMAVMHELGVEVKNSQVITGESLKGLTAKGLSMRLKNHSVKLFARTAPAQKQKIVESLKKNGEVVAMMGDGVNDAPALKKADIGIVVGEASDVAKETADLVLLDSDFSTIVAAIEEGRGIFDNIRKIILYLMCDAFEEIILVVATLILKLPLPVTAGQILWINIVSDGFPNLALTVDPKRAGIMNEPPRSPGEKLVAGWVKDLILIVSLVGGAMAFAIYYLTMNKYGDINIARSAAFATLGINSLFYVFSIRTLTEPFWRESPFSNKWLIGAFFGGIIFQLMPFVVPAFGRFISVVEIPVLDWLLVFGASLIMFIIIEVTKEVTRLTYRKTK